MLTLFTEGGFPMWFLLAFGLGTLFFAARYAHSPTHRGLRVTLGLGVATAFTAVTGILSDLAAVGHHAPKFLETHPAMSLVQVLLQGMAESMSPGILGFTMLSLAALLVTYGLFREAGA